MRRDEYERNTRDVAAALSLGASVEELRDFGPGEIHRIASWLASEGIGKLDAVSEGADDGGK